MEKTEVLGWEMEILDMTHLTLTSYPVFVWTCVAGQCKIFDVKVWPQSFFIFREFGDSGKKEFKTQDINELLGKVGDWGVKLPHIEEVAALIYHFSKKQLRSQDEYKRAFEELRKSYESLIL
jgi:hypothetical protein